MGRLSHGGRSQVPLLTLELWGDIIPTIGGSPWSDGDDDQQQLPSHDSSFASVGGSLRGLPTPASSNQTHAIGDDGHGSTHLRDYNIPRRDSTQGNGQFEHRGL